MDDALHSPSDPLGIRQFGTRIDEVEITGPVSLTLPDGRLNADAVGWARQPFVNTDGVGRGRVGFGRNKRWEYWAFTSPRFVVALVVSTIDYAGVNSLWVRDRDTGEVVAHEVITPLGTGVRVPGTLGAAPATLSTRSMSASISETRGGTRVTARTDRIRLDLLAERPEGHESLAVVVPWTDRLFQYTVKDLARPATGSLWIDGGEHVLEAGESWATLDHGRGRWPHRASWNWGAGTGRSGGHVVGVQVGGRWTDGTGVCENSLLLDGRLHKISEELDWAHDAADWLAPWRVSGEDVDLVFTPEYDKYSNTDLRIVSSSTHQCFGVWSGHVRVREGGERWVRIEDAYGWAEEVHQRW